MLPLIVAGGALAVTGALVLAKPQPALPPPAPPVPPAGPVEDRGTAGGGTPAVVPPQPITAGPPPAPKPFPLELPKELGDVGKLAGQIGVGLKVADAIGQGVEKLAGQGAGNLARIALPAAVGFAAKGATEKLLAKVGLPSGSKANKLISQTVGVAAGTGGLGVPLKLTAEAVSLGIRAIGGKKAEEDTRSFFRKLDPSNHTNVTAKPFAAVGSAIKSLGGLFGKKKK